MPGPYGEPDPDDTAADFELEEVDLSVDDTADDDGDSFVWDAEPADTGNPSPSGGSRSGSNPGPGGSRSGSMSGSMTGEMSASQYGEGATWDSEDQSLQAQARSGRGNVDRQAADELGLGFMDDDDLEGAGGTLTAEEELEQVRLKKAKTAEVKRQLTSAGGQFVIGLIVGLITVAAIIMGATNYTNNTILIPAAVITPFGLWYTLSRWKRWIGTAPYCYRLLSSLGEDAENLKLQHAQKQMRKATKEMRKVSNR